MFACFLVFVQKLLGKSKASQNATLKNFTTINSRKRSWKRWRQRRASRELVLAVTALAVRTNLSRPRVLAMECRLMRRSCSTGTCGLVAMTSASHAEGRQFDPGQVYFPLGRGLYWFPPPRSTALRAVARRERSRLACIPPSCLKLVLGRPDNMNPRRHQRVVPHSRAVF